MRFEAEIRLLVTDNLLVQLTAIILAGVAAGLLQEVSLQYAPLAGYRPCRPRSCVPPGPVRDRTGPAPEPGLNGRISASWTWMSSSPGLRSPPGQPSFPGSLITAFWAAEWFTAQYLTPRFSGSDSRPVPRS